MKTTATKTTTKVKRTYRKCVRCNGTGMWSSLDRGGVCFGCNGTGRRLNWTKDLELEAKRAHVVEVRGIIADLETRAPSRFAASNRQRAEEIIRRREQLVTLVAEVAALEVRA